MAKTAFLCGSKFAAIKCNDVKVCIVKLAGDDGILSSPIKSCEGYDKNATTISSFEIAVTFLILNLCNWEMSTAIMLSTFYTAPFVALLAQGEFKARADINYSGEVDFLDIAPFVTILVNTGS